MTLRPALLAACLLSASAAAADPVDLTDWLAPLPLAGDYKVFATSDGQTVREEIVSVEAVAGGFRIEKRFVNGDGDAILVEESLTPGVGTSTTVLATDPVPFPHFVGALVGDERSYDLSTRIGKPQRFKKRWYIWFIVNFTYRLHGAHRFHGFDSLETPYASHPSAARMDYVGRTTSTRLFFGRGFFDVRRTGWVSVEKARTWFVEGIGLVGETNVTRDYYLGDPRERSGSEVWLREGVIGGVPYP
jgi:hypothetical protein